MKKSLAVFLFVIVGTFLCGNALALQTYIPHITGGAAAWTDYLQVNNNTPSSASYTLALYNINGTQIYSQVHSVGGLSRSQIELKTLNSTAETGIITYTEPGLVFRVSYKSTGGGVAEFKTIDTLNSSIGFCFSDFVNFVEWKGAAIANMGTTSAEVTLYAIGGSVQGSGGTILGTHTLSIGPKQKIARLHTTWFSSVALSQIESIVAVTGSPSLCGIAIASDNAQSRLLFTPAVPVANFNPPDTTPFFSDSFDFINSSLWNYSSAWNYADSQPSTPQFSSPSIANGVLFISTLPGLSLAANDNAYYGVTTSSLYFTGDFLLKIRCGVRTLVASGTGDYSASLNFRLEDETTWESGNHMIFGLSKGQQGGNSLNVATLHYRQNGQDVPIGGNYMSGTMFVADISSVAGDIDMLTVRRTGATITAAIGETLIGSITNSTTSNLRLTINPVIWNSQRGSVQSFTAGVDDIQAYR